MMGAAAEKQTGEAGLLDEAVSVADPQMASLANLASLGSWAVLASFDRRPQLCPMQLLLFLSILWFSMLSLAQQRCLHPAIPNLLSIIQCGLQHHVTSRNVSKIEKYYELGRIILPAAIESYCLIHFD